MGLFKICIFYLMYMSVCLHAYICTCACIGHGDQEEGIGSCGIGIIGGYEPSYGAGLSIRAASAPN